jgi:hypothetical protein
MVVYPLAPVTYTLTGTSVSGITAAAQSQVAVSGNAGSSLVYEPPSDPTRALQLVADACPAPCTRLTFRIVRGAAASVRGIALDLPFNPTRIALPDPPAFNVRPGAAGGIARGSAAPLRDMLVVGAGMKQAAGQPPVEVTDAPGELANFDVLLVPGAGPGVVFDGSPAPDGRLPIVDVRGSSLAAGGIAIGKLRVVE